jgi:lactate permease
MDFLVAFFPIVLLIFLMTLKKGVPAHFALWLTALLLYLAQLFYLGSDSALVHAAVLSGVLTTATPALILWGAVFFFRTLEAAGTLSLLRKWLNGISPHPAAQLMLIAWAFSFFIEGVSGFGTPVVMAAPLLVGMGFDPIRVVVLCLAMNTIPVSFGAVGTPMWFGFGELNLPPDVLAEVGWTTAWIHGAAALIIPVAALAAALPAKTLIGSLRFIYLSIAATLLPYILMSKFSFEFPSIAGGLAGSIITVWLAKKNIGLPAAVPAKPGHPEFSGSSKLTARESFIAFFPFAAVVGLLALTRFKFFGIQEWLMSGTPLGSLAFPGVGEAFVSSSLVLELRNILSTDTVWKHPLLYVPSLIPFGLVSGACFFILKIPGHELPLIWRESIRKISKPCLVLAGSMVFVKLFMLGGDRSPAVLLGYGLAQAGGGVWNYAAVYLGALGAFFSGSCTVSNLTFGPVQAAVAERFSLGLPLILSLQSVGGAMGNMICIHNIVAVSAVLGLRNQEAGILRQTFPLMLLYGAVAAVTASLFFRF